MLSTLLSVRVLEIAVVQTDETGIALIMDTSQLRIVILPVSRIKHQLFVQKS